MEFSILCPSDGPVMVGLEHITSIVVRGGDSVEVVFACPHCGRELRVNAQVPKMLLATLEDAMVVDERTGENTISLSGLAARGLLPTEAAAFARVEIARRSTATATQPTADDALVDRYCEYFRRQLATVASADAMLREIDGR